jgi:hypothetical protein
MKNKEQTAQSTQVSEVSVMNINSRNVFNQMIRNIKTDKDKNKNNIIIENINAKNLNDFDGINVINDDEYIDHIICLIDILSKEIE